ncbi:MAG: multiheme c-type cytochrome [Anaerolineales bacterium]
MRKFFVRLVYGLVFAVPLMIVTYALALAADQGSVLSTTGQQPTDCATCHQEFQAAWEKSRHGIATSDPAFQLEWEKAGKPGDCLECHVTGYDAATGTWQADGITCVACHNPVPENHPLEPMGSDSSSQLCGTCHNETYFQWQVSGHRQGGLDCYGCHDPHATGLKAENSAILCANCHRDRSSNFTHSAHSQQGLTCANCHLANIDGATSGEGHGTKDHSFFVSLTTCNTCHVYQMHDPVAVHPENPTPAPADAMSSVETATVSHDPVPVSPVGFTALSGLVGVALGVIIAPWIDRLQRQRRIDDEEK